MWSGSWMTVADNSVGDANPATSQVTWIGSLGNWNLNVDTGTSFPVIGTLDSPQLDLSFDATTSTGGTLWIYLSDNGFGPTFNVSTLANIGGTTGGTVSYWAFGGASNNLFDTTQLLFAGPFNGPSFSADVAGAAINNAGPYSLTEVIEITQPGAGTSSGDAMLSVPDGGTTALLLGAGLLGLGVVASKRKLGSIRI
jgi:hypothetical protein